jgi:cobalt-zinc-cadmium resistance protein CzcA
VADVNDSIELAVGGKRVTQVVEGEKLFDVTLRWPETLRRNEEAILDVPVDLPEPPPAVGQPFAPPAPLPAAPRLRLRDLVSPQGADGAPDPEGKFVRSGASAIWREEGQRLIAVRFRARDRVALVAEARGKLAPLFQAPYRAEWSAGP